jgi:hypothetical protein
MRMIICKTEPPRSQRLRLLGSRAHRGEWQGEGTDRRAGIITEQQAAFMAAGAKGVNYLGPSVSQVSEEEKQARTSAASTKKAKTSWYEGLVQQVVSKVKGKTAQTATTYRAESNKFRGMRRQRQRRISKPQGCIQR